MCVLDHTTDKDYRLLTPEPVNKIKSQKQEPGKAWAFWQLPNLWGPRHPRVG